MKRRPPQSALTRSTDRNSGRVEYGTILTPQYAGQAGGSLGAQKISSYRTLKARCCEKKDPVGAGPNSRGRLLVLGIGYRPARSFTRNS